MRRIFTLAAIAATLGVQSAAFAQTGGGNVDYYPYNFTVRGGVALPIDDRLSDLDNTLIALGADYTIGRPLLKGGESYLSLDYLTPGFQGHRGSVFPLMLNQRFYTGDRGAGRRTYAFVGLGVAFIDVDNAETAVAARGGFGAELSDNFIFEVAGYLSDRAGGARANSIAFYVGFRF